MNDFQPYSVYYSTPQGGPGQIPIAGHHFYAEGLSLPIVAESAEEVKARGERAAQDRLRARKYTGPTAADLDAKYTEVHERNEQHRSEA